MKSRRNYARALNQWWLKFSAAAAADNYAELRRPIEHLKLKGSTKNTFSATLALVNAVVACCELDGRDCECFLKQQRYIPKSGGESKYCLLFDLGGTRKRYGRLLTDAKFTGIDLEDLFDFPWPMFGTAGFTEVWVTRLDGKRIDKRERTRLYNLVSEDMYWYISWNNAQRATKSSSP